MADALKLNDVDQFGTQQTADGVVDLLTPVSLLWLRDVPISTSALVSADTTKKVLVFDPDDTTIPKEGEWVRLDVVTGEATTIDSQGAYGYLVYAGRGRKDIPAAEGVTVLMGGFVAETDTFVTSDSGADVAIDSNTAFGAPLTTSSTGKLSEAAGSDRVVGFFEALVTRNGTSLVRFHTHGAGGIY